MDSQILHVKKFNQLYQDYNQRFIRFAKSYVLVDEIAEDIVNDSFVYYWENIQNITDQNISSYLLTIVKHKCLNYLKRLAIENQAKDRFLSIEKWELQLKISTLEACEPKRLLSEEIQSIVQKELNSMPKQTRDILLKSKYQLKTNKEIASEMQISIKTVEYHKSKALKALRIALKDYFIIWLLFV